MATTTYTVKKGDTLSEIAQKYYKTYGYTNLRTYMNYLAAINDIDDVDKIYVGEKIKLTGSATKTNKNTLTSKKATVKRFGLQSNTDRTIFATWTWNNDNTANYKTRWYYSTGDGVWFIGADNDSTTANLKQSLYSAPANAEQVKFHVKPVSKTKPVTNSKGKKVETPYWTADWSDAKYYKFVEDPGVPPQPKVSIDKYKLTAEIDNLDTTSPNGTHIEFQVVKDNGAKAYKTSSKLKIVNTYVSYTCTVTSGSEYKVRCRAVRGKLYSDWTDYTSPVECSVPAVVKEIKKLSFSRKKEENGEWVDAVHIDWDAAKSSETYEIEYTTNKSYFDYSPGNVQSQTIAAPINYAIITGLTLGVEYFFRLRSVKGEEKTAWTPIKSIIVGTKPAAPTTWSSTNTVVVGEKLTLYWTHNSEDGSDQTYAQIEISSGDKKRVINREGAVYSFDISTKAALGALGIEAVDGATIKWRVRTKGVFGSDSADPANDLTGYSEWSTKKTVKSYVPPSLELVVTKTNDVDGERLEEDELTSFPMYIRGIPSSTNQKPIEYFLTITADSGYETVDEVGNDKSVMAGEVVYSTHMSASATSTGIMWARISADNVDFKSGVDYTIKCIAYMNSGLTAEASYHFEVHWREIGYEPNAEISIDEDSLTAIIRPYCELYEEEYYRAKRDTTTGEVIYVPTKEKLNMITKRYLEEPVYTTSDDPDLDGYMVYYGRDDTGTQRYFYIVEKPIKKLPNVTLDVYRRETDGSFTEIATDIKNSRATYITDPHPSLDFARYRIVSKTKTTGAIEYYDVPGHPVGESSIVLQWDADWSEFKVDEDGNAESNANWSGSMVKLPYNIDISYSTSPDVELVEYIGRSHPVSYYGTQIGSTATWNAVIEKDDTATLHGLRQLQRWTGNVYVREPSGIGYWANVTVSMSQKHLDQTVPVTLNITRVEGGM